MLLIRNSLINVSDIADVKGEEKMAQTHNWSFGFGSLQFTWWGILLLIAIIIVGVIGGIYMGKKWHKFIWR